MASGQIPVSCVLTSASVHDSQVAIPLMTMTSARVCYLYDLMDLGFYDAAPIHDRSRALGHEPIVDRNFRADQEARAEWSREVERMKLIHMPDFDDVIYDFLFHHGRTRSECSVERRVRRHVSPRPGRAQGQMPSDVALSPSPSIRTSASSTPGPPPPD